MVAYLIVGAPQTGKTTYVKENIISHYKNGIVYDVQNQYENLPWYKPNLRGWSRISPTDLTFEKFIMLGQALTNFMFVYEEATQFLEGRISLAMKANLVGKAHTKNRFLFFFHSFSQVPPRIMDFTDYLIQFRTGVGDLEGVKSKGKTLEIIQAYKDLEIAPRFSKRIHRISVLAKENIF
jgi:hypothetical protein